MAKNEPKEGENDAMPLLKMGKMDETDETLTLWNFFVNGCK